MTGHGFDLDGSDGTREVALRRLSIVDEEGNVAMRLDRNGIGIYGPGEKLQMLLGPSDEGGVIHLRDAAGRRRLAIDARGQAGILVFGEDERPRVAVRGGGEILIYDVEGTVRVILGR
ncbi:MAG TPA: hypothetical protein VKF62_00930, partial [Planctomycetota bacterium]|nr:hypothetical protein [Planctomycetota bacterium]